MTELEHFNGSNAKLCLGEAQIDPETAPTKKYSVI